MTLITNKTLDYVLDHLGEKNVYNIDIKRDTLDVCIELLKNNSKNAEIYYDASDRVRFMNYLNSHGINTVNSYSKSIDNKSFILCSIYDGNATIVAVNKILK